MHFYITTGETNSKPWTMTSAEEGEYNPTAKPHLHDLSCICSHDGDKTNSPYCKDGLGFFRQLHQAHSI